MTDTEQTIIPARSTKRVIFSDTDTLSSFLRRNAFGYFLNLFDHLNIEVIIPTSVIQEMEYNDKTTQILATPIKNLEKQGRLKIADILVGTDEYRTYRYLTEDEDMGKGEAAALSMATHSEYTASVASNNLSDIGNYIREHHIDLWTTSRILYESERYGIITRKRAAELWKKMIEDDLRLPFNTYEDYIKSLV